jgi:hypothetical protein
VQDHFNRKQLTPQMEGHMAIVRHASAGLIASGALLIAMVQASPAHANTELMLVNHKTFKCVTIAGGTSAENNVKSVQFDCDSDRSRRWTLLERPGDDIYMIRNALTGKCLTIAGGESTDNNVIAVQFTCDNHPSRTWRLRDVTGTGVYQIRNVQTGKCLTIAGGTSTANNIDVLQFSCDGDPSRRWTLKLKP